MYSRTQKVCTLVIVEDGVKTEITGLTSSQFLKERKARLADAKKRGFVFDPATGLLEKDGKIFTVWGA